MYNFIVHEFRSALNIKYRLNLCWHHNLHWYVTLSLLNNINEMSPRKIMSLQKHTYSSNLKILQPKWKFSDEIMLFFIFLLKNIDCGYSLEPPWWGGFNEYSHSVFLSKIKKNEYPCQPLFYYIKWGSRGQNYKGVFSWRKSPENDTIEIQTFLMPGGAKVSCILRHRGVQLILAYSWARPSIPVAGKGRERNVLPLSSLSLSFISSAISSISFLPFYGRRHKMTHKGWRVVKPQHNQSINIPDAPKKEKMRKQWQNKRHIWNHRRTDKDELQHRTALEWSAQNDWWNHENMPTCI